MSMTSPVDKKQIKTNWNDRNYSCDMFVDPPGQRWEDFTHPVDELVMVIEGKLEIEMQGRIFSPEVGEEVFIPAKVNHSVRNIGGTISKWLYGYKNV